MSNRSRGERADTLPRNPHISREEQIRTLRLYLKHRNSNRVGEILGICGASVRDRLYAMGAELNPRGYRHDDRSRDERNLELLGRLLEQERRASMRLANALTWGDE